MKIIVADRISEHGVKLLADPGWQVVQPAAAALASELAEADALVVRSATQVTDELLSHARRLRVIGRAGVGVDNIDLDAATRRGILVMNTPGGNAPSVAEHALALMLSMARSIPQLNASMHAGKWEKSGAAGAELRGKTLGLIGLGRVGAEVARRARALEMRVLAYDPYVSTERAAEWGAELVPLAELLAQADYVSLHTSLSPATERMASLVAQAAPFPARRLRIACAGEPAELGTRVLRSAALAGVLNAVLDEHVNLVNAAARAVERGLEIEEGRRPRERGIADVLEIAAYSAGDGKRREFSALGTILYGTP